MLLRGIGSGSGHVAVRPMIPGIDAGIQGRREVINRMLTHVVGCGVAALCVRPALAETFHVFEGESIQAAINNAYHGDEVVVHPGTYFEAIGFYTREILVRSSDGPEVTIIDATGLVGRSVVEAIHGEGPEAILEGFTLTGGEGSNDDYWDPALGGGMRIHQSSPTIRNCIFECNSASDGGAIHSYEGDPTFADCVFRSNAAFRGGGVYTYEGNLEFENCRFEENAASYGGGGLHGEDAEMRFLGCVFARNEAVYGAGGLRAWRSPVQMIGCEFTQNVAEDYGGASISGDGSVVSNCVFTDNIAVDGNAGALSCYGDSATVTACTFIGNFAASHGGAIAGGDVSMTIADCTFTDNRAKYGGAASFDSRIPALLRCTFIGNSCLGGYGGAVYMYDWAETSPKTVACCTFIDNSAVSGGAVYGLDVLSLRMFNCLFQGNGAYAGGGLGMDGWSEAEISACTFVGNIAVEGSSVWIDDPGSRIDSSILWGDVIDPLDGSVDVRHCCIQGGAEGVGNIDADPMFVDPENGDYRLLPGSPCIDAGFNAGLPADEYDLDEDGLRCERIPVDFDGNHRFADDPNSVDVGCGLPFIVDMGACEFAGSPADVVFGDVDGNGTVDMDDLFNALADWGQEDGCFLGDVDGNGIVDMDDIFAVLDNWGPCSR